MLDLESEPRCSNVLTPPRACPGSESEEWKSHGRGGVEGESWPESSAHDDPRGSLTAMQRLFPRCTLD